jgi:WD40 repeat protein
MGLLSFAPQVFALCYLGNAAALVSPYGRRLVSGSWDQTVRVWDARSSAELARLRGHAKWISSVAFSPDGRHLVSGSWDQTARVWDGRTRSAEQATG